MTWINSVTHIVGSWIEIGGRVIQRCAWCGEKLLDSKNVAMPLGPNGEEPSFPTWPPGRLVRFSGTQPRCEHLLPESAQLPSDSCVDLVE